MATRPPPGRCWHHMEYCEVCGSLPALPLPREEALCRRHGGRVPAEAERWTTGAAASWGFKISYRGSGDPE